MTEYLDQVAEAERRLREVIREAHETLKDLRQADRQLRRFLDNAEDIVSARLQEHVKHHTEELAALFTRVTKSSTDKLMKRFEDVTNVFLGKGNGLDLDEAAKQVRATMNAVRVQKNPDPIPPFWRQMPDRKKGRQ